MTRRQREARKADGPPSEYAVALGMRLRAVRNRLAMSLADVEKKSAGEWKAVCIGSYERGNRRITAEQLVSLCQFYGVSAGEILTGDAPMAPVEFANGWLPRLAGVSAELSTLVRRAQMKEPAS